MATVSDVEVLRDNRLQRQKSRPNQCMHTPYMSIVPGKSSSFDAVAICYGIVCCKIPTGVCAGELVLSVHENKDDDDQKDGNCYSDSDSGRRSWTGSRACGGCSTIREKRKKETETEIEDIWLDEETLSTKRNILALIETNWLYM